jgi:hypothetical protein
MPEPDLIPEPWGAFLRDLDEIATEPVDFYCIGGFVITRKYGYQRETNDLDVLDIAPSTQRREFLQKGTEGSELHLKHHVYLDLVTVIEAYPEDYETRVTEMYPAQLNRIRLFAPEAHDLALMKLGRNIERDREDVKFLARQGFITPEELNRRYEKEMRSYISLPDRGTDQVLSFWVEMIQEDDSLTKAKMNPPPGRSP